MARKTSRCSPLKRAESSLTVTGPGSHGGLQPPQHLLKGQHSRAQIIQYADDNFLLQVTEELTRGSTLLSLTLTNKRDI